MTDATVDGLPTLLPLLAAYLETEDGRALTLPPASYRSTALLALERERIFRRSWLLIGRAEQVARPGDYIAADVVGERIVIVRGADGVVRALSGICRHRMMPVVEEGCGHVEAFTCPYHLWRYALDGKLAGAPFMQETPGFEKSQCALPPIAVETWQGFLFVNLDATAAPLAAKLGAVAQELAAYDLANAVEVARYDRVWNTNWKLAVENASESYHHMGMHPASVNPDLPTNGPTTFVDGRDYARLHLQLPSGVRPRFDHWAPLVSPDPEQTDGMRLFTIFPSTFVLTTGGLCNWGSFLPVDCDRTRLIAGLTLPAGVRAEPGFDEIAAGYSEAIEQINAEDERGCTVVHRATGSAFAARGHMSHKERGGLLAFYRYLARALATPGDRVAGQ